jgi:predicted DNA-binding protein (MmcQ/YjbR family)
MTGKYSSLETYLRELPSTQAEVTLSFAQIEKIINSKLPASAYEDNRWWEHETEGNHMNKRAWVTAGWRVDEVDVKKKRAKFKRER